MSVLGDNIKKYRVAAGLTQHEIAKILEVTDMTISRYETGQREPNIDTLIELSHLFNINIESLLGIHLSDDHPPIEEMIDEIGHQEEKEAYFEAVREYESTFAEHKNKMLESFNKLNLTGKEKAAERVEELTYIDKYTRKE